MSLTSKKNAPNEQINELLREFGLSQKESQVYLSALKLGNALVKDISRHCGLNRTTTYNLLLGLRKVGLVSSYQKQKLTYFSVSAPSILQNIADQRIRQQEELKKKLQELAPVLNGLFQSRSRNSTVKIYEGIDSLPEIYRAVYHATRHPAEGLEFTNWGSHYALFPRSAREDLNRMRAVRNVRVRSLLVENELTRGWYEEDQGRSENKIIRLLPNPGWDFFCNLELCENRFAIVTYKNNIDAQGIVIENTELASMIRFMFESLWQSLPQ